MLSQLTLLKTLESSGLNAAWKCAVSRHHREQKGLALHHTAVYSFCTGFKSSLYPNHRPGYSARPPETSLVRGSKRKKGLCHLLSRARKVKQLPAPSHGTCNHGVMGSPLPEALTCAKALHQFNTASSHNELLASPKQRRWV